MEQKSTNNEAMKLMVETITLHTHYLTSLNCLAKMENSALLKKKKNIGKLIAFPHSRHEVFVPSLCYNSNPSTLSTVSINIAPIVKEC